MNPRGIFSKVSDHWSTPAAAYAALDAEFGFTFDPCPLKSPVDGRTQPWWGRVFCNPPYSKITDFIQKGLYHLARKDCELLVYLLPSRTDRPWFHDYCLRGEIRFLKGRLKFGGSKINAPFPSMVVVFREWDIEALPLEAVA